MQNLRPWRTALTVGVAITVVNVLILGIARLAGADMVERTSGAANQVGAAMVAAASLAPALLGGLLLHWAARRRLRAWIAVGRLGPVVALLTLPAPLWAADAAVLTALSLATMHVVAGLGWWAGVHIEAKRAVQTVTPAVQGSLT